MAAQIHPTAIVDSSVQLGSDVIIGPYCVLQGDITLGDGCQLVAHVFLKGPLVVGANGRFSAFSSVGEAPQDRGYDPDEPEAGCVLGDHNVIREHVSIHRATGEKPTRLGDDNLLMASSHVGHDSQLGSHITLANNALIAGHVEVGDAAFLGGNSGVHQFCRVGRLAIISGQRAVVQDVPPFCNVLEMRSITGLNRVGLRRAGLRDAIKPLQQAFDLLFRSGVANTSAVERVRRQLGYCPCCLELADFIAGSKRGVCRYYNRKHVAENLKPPD